MVHWREGSLVRAMDGIVYHEGWPPCLCMQAYQLEDTSVYYISLTVGERRGEHLALYTSQVTFKSNLWISRVCAKTCCPSPLALELFFDTDSEEPLD